MQGRVCASPNTASVDYVARLNRAVDYITGNLDQPLRLEEVARAACFSTRNPMRCGQRTLRRCWATPK